MYDFPHGRTVLTERELNRALARLPRETRPALQEEVERLSDFLA
jgi:hypothetical protein